MRGDTCLSGGQRPADQRGHGPGTGADVQGETYQTAAVHHQRKPPPADPGTLQPHPKHCSVQHGASKMSLESTAEETTLGWEGFRKASL